MYKWKLFILRGGLFSILFLLLAFLLFYIGVYSTVPGKATFASLKNATSSEVYSSDGVLLGKYFIHDRTNVKLENISSSITNALIATEDVRFYEHHGVDRRGLLRVFFKTLLLGDESSGGGSTITQQLAKNLFPRKDYGFFSMPVNKLREAILAEKLESVFSKEEILTLYLNTVPFGENAYGIEVASQRFFSKPASDLKTEEAALLVGMLKATTYYNPLRHPEASKERRNTVLAQMARYGFLKPTQRDSLQTLPVRLKYRYINQNRGLATYFREQIRQELNEWCSAHKKEDGTSYNLYTDGLKIYTTIDSKLQQYAEKAVTSQMTSLQAKFIKHWGNRDPWGKNFAVVADAMHRSVRYKELQDEGKSKEEIRKIFNAAVPTRLFSWKGTISKDISPLDSIKYYLKFLHAGFLVTNPKTGEVKAWVGGLNHEFFQYDHVNVNAKRQVGSTFKPIVYAAALEVGVPPCEYFPNEQLVYAEYENWSPANADGQYGGKYSLEGALTNSVNTVSAQVIMRAGPEKVVELAEKLGIESPLKPLPSLALGSADISLFEMVAAYGAFPNGGYYIKPHYIQRIETADGKVLEDFSELTSKRERVLSSYTAGLIVHMMENVVNRGTGTRLRYQYGLKIPVGGKTGTTQSHADGWFIGYTPDLVAGVWVGGEDRRVHFRSLEMGQGANMALPIWGNFMKKVLADPTFAYMKQARFRLENETIEAALSCDPYIAPEDTLSFWEKLFGPAKSDSVRNAERERHSIKKSPKRKSPDNNFMDGLFNIFRKKRR